MKVMLYIDLNPKRAGKVKHPKNNDFSSFAYYAYGKKDPLVTPAPCYLELGITAKRRQGAYLALVEEILQNDWKQKKPFSSTPFLGDPLWVLQQSKKLKEQQRSMRHLWRKRFKERFGKAA